MKLALDMPPVYFFLENYFCSVFLGVLLHTRSVSRQQKEATDVVKHKYEIYICV